MAKEKNGQAAECALVTGLRNTIRWQAEQFVAAQETISKLTWQLAVAQGEREGQVLYPLGSDCKPNRGRTCCGMCGTDVRDQKYCHGCGRKLVWADIQQRTYAIYEKLEQAQKGGKDD